MNSLRIGRSVLLGVSILSVGSLLLGCAGSVSNDKIGEESAAGSATSDVTADAYLFDARLNRHGKPTSFRLELYCTDSLVGVAGRAYLGKGAVRGRVTRDSLDLYFPAANEFLRDSISKVFSKMSCSLRVRLFNLISLIGRLPDSTDFVYGLTLHTVPSKPDRPVYTISSDSCSWNIQLEYNQVDTRWLLRDFRFTDTSIVSLHAERREVRTGITIAASKFQVVIPSDATPVEP